MRNTILRYIILMTTLVLTSSCSNTTPKTAPKDVAVKFTEALFTADFDTAEELCTENGKTSINSIKKLFGDKIELMKKSTPTVNFQLEDTQHDQESSTVEVTVKNSINPSTGAVYADELFITVRLSRNADGEWLVNSL